MSTVRPNRSDISVVGSVLMLEPEEAGEGEGHEGHEGVNPKTKKNPMLPSQEEVDDHYAANHVPFRNWCECCIKGKALNDPHSSLHRRRNRPVLSALIIVT